MSSARDVVGVYDSSFRQLFPNARTIRALVGEKAKAMEHPLESGATMTDHIVFLPTEIELSFILDPEGFQDTYQQIKAAWQSATLVSVQTKTDTYPDMLILEPPHDEVPEMFDTVAIAVKLRQAILVAAQYAQLPKSQVKKKSNSSTVKTGQKTGGATSGAQNSAAYDLIHGSH